MQTAFWNQKKKSSCYFIYRVGWELPAPFDSRRSRWWMGRRCRIEKQTCDTHVSPKVSPRAILSQETRKFEVERYVPGAQQFQRNRWIFHSRNGKHLLKTVPLHFIKSHGNHHFSKVFIYNFTILRVISNPIWQIDSYSYGLLKNDI